MGWNRRSTRTRGTPTASAPHKSKANEPSKEQDAVSSTARTMRKRNSDSDSGTATASTPNKKTKRSSKIDDSISPTKKVKGALLSKEDKVKEMDTKILKVMLNFHDEEKSNVRVEDVATELGVHIRTKGFRLRWGFLKNANLIGTNESGKGYTLTKAGLDEAATPEYKAMMKELAIVPKTNSEHQERLKKHLKKPKSVAIFDYLLKYGSLSYTELSPLVGTNHKSHGFFYSMKELRDRGYVEVDPSHKGEGKNGVGKKFRLAEKAFKAKEDRPKESDIDTEELAKAMAKGLDQIESQKRGSRSSSKTKNIKKEESVTDKDSDGVEVEAVTNEDSDDVEVEAVKNEDSDGVGNEELKSNDDNTMDVECEAENDDDDETEDKSSTTVDIKAKG